MQKYLSDYVRDICVVRRAARNIVTFAVLVFTGCSGAAGSPASDNAGSVANDASSENFAVNNQAVHSVVRKPESDKDTATTPAPLPAARHTSDADKDFLQHMLDHYEAVLVLVHADMMKPEGHAMHGIDGDPVERDGALDAEKSKMLQLLSKLYGEEYSPRPVAAAAAEAERGKAALHASLGTHFRAGVALVDRSAGGLRRPEVRALARQMRATQLALLKTTPSGIAPHK